MTNSSKRRGRLFVVAGSSGAGKTTLVQAVIPRLAAKYGVVTQRVVTYTSKSPRPGEAAGQDYHYLSPGEFQEKITQRFFLEWSQAYGHYYGTPAHLLALLAEGVSLFLIVDLAGVQALQQLYLADTIYIWIAVPLADLNQRLVQRRTETAVELANRLALARQETELVGQQTPQLFDFVLANDRELESAITDLEGLVARQLGL